MESDVSKSHRGDTHGEGSGRKKRGALWGGLSQLVQYAVVAVITGVLVELGVYVWITRMAGEEQFLRYASYVQIYGRMQREGRSFTKHVPHRFIGHVLSPDFQRGKNRHNALGYRDDPIAIPKPEGEYRIVCMGGSTTYTSFVEDYKGSYPLLLQEALRGAGFAHVRVINAGTPAHSTFESLVNFEFRILDLDPDMIIIYHAVNDLMARLVWPPSAYRGDASGSMQHSAGFFQPVRIYERSNALRMALIALGLADSHAGLLRCFVNFPPSAQWQSFFRQYKDGTYPSGLFKRVTPQAMLNANPPTYFRRNLEHLLVLAKYRGIQPVLCTFALCPEKPGHNSCEAMRNGVGEHNRMIKEIGDSLQVPVFDFAADFPNEARLFYDPDHVNARGAALKSKLIADFLIKRGLVPRVMGGGR